MNINEQRCPNCAGRLQTSYEDMKKECPFCGTVYVIEREYEGRSSKGISENIQVDVSNADESEARYAIKLMQVGPNKVKVIKWIRELTGLGLKDTKDLVDTAPCIILDNVDKSKADYFVSSMEKEVQGVVLEVIG